MKNNTLLRSRLLIFAVIMLSINIPALTQQQSKEITEKYFPNPTIEFNTPTLTIPENRFAGYPEIMQWVENISQTHPGYCTVKIIGKTPDGLNIPLIILSNPQSKSSKLKVWMQGALHGNEPAGAEGLFMLIDYLLNNSKGKQYLMDYDIAVLPIANMNGYLKQERRSANGYDLNRDQTKFADPVSIILKRAFSEWNPDMAFDFHEYQATRKEIASIGTNGASISYDALFLPTGYPNVPQSIRDMNINIFEADAKKALDKIKYTHNFYFSVDDSGRELTLIKGAKSPQSSSTSYALTNSISLLVEIRGIGLGRTSLERRTYTAFTIARSFLNSGLKNKKLITETLSKAKENTISRKDPVFILGKSKEEKHIVQFIDLESGNILDQPLKTLDALAITPTLTRERPAAYLLEKEAVAEVERLKIMGVEVTELKEDTSFTTESYLVTKKSEKKTWEKINPVKAQTQIIHDRKTFPKGSFIVSLAQKNANVAISVLEPEADNGFVTFRVSEITQGETLKIHRIMQ